MVVHSAHEDDSTPCLQVLQVFEVEQAAGKGTNEVVPCQTPSRKREVQMENLRNIINEMCKKEIMPPSYCATIMFTSS